MKIMFKKNVLWNEKITDVFVVDPRYILIFGTEEARPNIHLGKDFYLKVESGNRKIILYKD
jgi:hypothetical protein